MRVGSYPSAEMQAVYFTASIDWVTSISSRYFFELLGHCWRSRDELIRDVLLWIPTHGRTKAGRPARTYIQQLCEDTGCCPEDLPRAMNDREEWRERVRDICATSAIWWWWWWIIPYSIIHLAVLCFPHCWPQYISFSFLISAFFSMLAWKFYLSCGYFHIHRYHLTITFIHLLSVNLAMCPVQWNVCNYVLLSTLLYNHILYAIYFCNHVFHSTLLLNHLASYMLTQ